MDFELGILGLLALACVLVWWLNRSSTNSQSSSGQASSYVEGLNFLLNDQPDRAVEAFTESLDVNADTLETHLALGKLMRRQGHVDRAIRIHQNVLARPSLAAKDQHQVHLELAKDFMSAGLLDRAEMLLKEVIAESAELRSMAQHYLMEIYQDESEWLEAIEVARSLLQSKYVRSQPEEKKYITRLISHFYSELAIEARTAGDIDAARGYLNKAISTDKSGVRVAVLNAARLNAEQNYRQAIKLLSKIGVDDPAWFSACLPTLLESYEGLHPEKGVESLWQYLNEKSSGGPSAAEVLFITKTLIEKSNKAGNVELASEILKQYLDKHNNLALSNLLLGVTLNRTSQGEKNDNHYLAQLHQELERHIGQQKLYRCQRCGFSGRQLNWRCPSCKHWDSCQRVDEVSA